MTDYQPLINTFTIISMSTVFSVPLIPLYGTSDFGIKVLVPGGDAPMVDIVAIHGLDGPIPIMV
ncbi:hypothetical protein BU17DRAFT_88855 [Hysterangium stoloniferum]|nr:hypothetical protein BU17DRAFT_88855 [Hysterangium stoloniferum]